eukprot:4873947-Pyramimonas_sp.AAC.1
MDTKPLLSHSATGEFDSPPSCLKVGRAVLRAGWEGGGARGGGLQEEAARGGGEQARSVEDVTHDAMHDVTRRRQRARRSSARRGGAVHIRRRETVHPVRL